MPSRRFGKWIDAAWVLSMGARGGLVIVLPVFAGLVLGYWLDTQLGTLPFVSIALTLAGGIAGPIVLYRWVVSAVNQWMEAKKQAEEKPE